MGRSGDDSADADAIAAVLADLRAGRVRHVLDDPQVNGPALALIQKPTVVDATAIYRSLVARDQPVHIYEDHPCISPPWEEAAICYRNAHGNVLVMHASSQQGETPEALRWETAEEVDWDRVRWRLTTFLWLGGRSQTTQTAIPVTGPVHAWRFAIYDDGRPADLHWVHLVEDYPIDNWDMAHLTLLGALNFLNCRNVQLVEPQRPRAQRRRLKRLGVAVHTINVLPVSKSTRGRSSADGAEGGVPLTSVRGHFACYGPEYGRGLLFGKLAGRFWIAQHARGDSEHGESVSDYALQPASRGRS